MKRSPTCRRSLGWQPSDLYLRTDTYQQLIFAHPFRNGWIFAGCSIVMWALVSQATESGWGFDLLCGGLVAIGLYNGLRRERLDFDLQARTYTRLKGFWPAPARDQGAFDELQGVLLTREWCRNKPHHYRVWKVALLFHSAYEPISVLASKNEPEARRRFEHFARILQIDALDRTHNSEKVTPWDLLADSRREARKALVAAARAIEAEEPPQVGGFELSGAPGRRIILLPVGERPGCLMLALLTVPLCAVTLALCDLLGYGPFQVASHVMWPVHLPFLAAGLGVLFLWISLVFGRHRIEEQGDDLLFSTHVLGCQINRSRMCKRKIEDITIRATSPRLDSARELVIRSDQHQIRIGHGRRSESLEWLKKAILTMSFDSAQSSQAAV